MRGRKENQAKNKNQNRARACVSNRWQIASCSAIIARLIEK